MSKANVLSKQYREFREQCGVKDPVILDEIEEAYFEGYNQAERDLTDKAKTSSGWDGFFYGQGYRQAEKDLELSLEDMVLFRTLFDAIDVNIRLGSIKIQPMTKEYYQEVLKRFNKERKETKD